MKRIFTLLTALSISAVTFAQSATSTATTFSQITRTGRAWAGNLTGGVPNFTATPLNNGANSQFTDYLVFSGFGFSLPTNISATSITVTLATSSPAGGVNDDEILLVVGGSVVAGANAGTGAAWAPTPQNRTFVIPAAAFSGLNGADFNAANFGIAISAARTTGNTSATVTGDAANRVTMTINYITLAPIILTDFSVNKNADNHVAIRFSTSSEENVQNIFIERSTDNKTFEKLFTITPKGARNVYTSYAMVDKAPAAGNNYYRISEVDKNGRWYYYMTKLVNVTRNGASFNAYFNGGQVVANISNLPGQYEVSIVDMSGITISRKSVTLSSGTGQVSMDAPARPGVYVVIAKGQGTSEAIRVAVNK